MRIFKLIEKINIEFLKKKFNEQSEINVGIYTFNLNSREMFQNKLRLKLTEKEINSIIYLNSAEKSVNIQELQSIAYHKMPIKIFVLNNDGYHSIRQSQKNYYNGKEIGCGPESGISFPNFKRVCESFGIKAYQVNTLKKLENNINKVFKINGPTLTEIIIDKNQLFEPRLSSKKLDNGQIVSLPLEDMAPFLDREEFVSNMIIKAWKEDK